MNQKKKSCFLPLGTLFSVIVFMILLASCSVLTDKNEYASYPLYTMTDEGKYITKYYVIESDLPHDELELVALYVDDISEMLLNYLPHAETQLSEDNKIRMFLLSSEQFRHNAYGYYDSRNKEIHVNTDLGIGTIGHEIVHYLQDIGNYDKDEFDSEGVAMAFEKTISYYGDEATSYNTLTYGYHHPRRQSNALQHIEMDDPKFSLEKFLKQEKYNLDSVQQDIIGSLFIYTLQEGKLQAYTTLLDKELTRLERFEKALGNSITDIEQDFRFWLRQSATDPDFTLVLRTYIMTDELKTPGGRKVRWHENTTRWTQSYHSN